MVSITSTLGGDGNGGITKLHFSDGSGTTLAANSGGFLRLSDGKFLAFPGVGSDAGVVRFNADGTLDTSFGTNGVAVYDYGAAEKFRSSVQTGDGHIFVIDQLGTNQSAGNAVVLKLNADGSLDTSAGTNGAYTFSTGNIIRPVALGTADGQLLLAGGGVYTGAGGIATVTDADHWNFNLAKLNANGTLDTSYGANGFTILDRGGFEQAQGAARLADNSFLVVGQRQIKIERYMQPCDFQIAKLDANGNLDTSWGNAGYITTDFSTISDANPRNDAGFSIAVTPGGKFFVIGTSGTSAYTNGSFTGQTGTPNVAVAKYNADGSLDTSFGTEGKFVQTINGLQQPGNVVYAGSGKILISVNPTVSGVSTQIIERLNADGTLDTSFGTNGKITTTYGGSSATGNGLTIDANGNIMTSAAVTTNGVTDFVVARYSADGVLDTSFGVASNSAPANHAPTITSNGGEYTQISVDENTTVVTTITATDADAGSTISFSIAGGPDADLFQIDQSTGALSFKTAPNFEAPDHQSGNNYYGITVQVSDGTLTDMQEITVAVTNVAEAPTITSDGGNASAAVSINENATVVTTVTATDVDANSALSYAITGGADADLFQIDQSTGALSFKTAPNFEAPADQGGNNQYDVIVQASDGTLTDTQAIAVTVTDVAEAPTTNNGPGLPNKVGGEFLVNTETASYQERPTVTGLANGGFVVTWIDQSGTLGDSSDSSIKAQLFSADGTKVATEFLVNTETASLQYYPTITGLANGGFVVMWNDNSRTLGDSDSFSIKAQLFSADGTKVATEFLVNTETANYQFEPKITGLANGGFVVTWYDYSGTLGDSDGSSIKAQLFSADGTKVATEFLVNTETANYQQLSTVTGLANGGFVVTWVDHSGTLGDSSDSSIKAQLFSADGTKVATEFLVNTETASYQFLPTITSLTNGDFVVTWIDESGTLGDSDYSVKAQVFSADGAKVGTEFLVNTETDNYQGSPKVTGLANGGFVVTWTDLSGTLGDSDGPSIKAQVFSTDGTKVGTEFLVNTETVNSQYEPTITGLANGGFVVTWSDFSGTLGDSSGNSIKAQIFSANGSPVPPVLPENHAPAITSNGGNDASISVDENATAVTTVNATDVDAGDTVTYAISNDWDGALFQIDANTGVLSFKSAPNYVANDDNLYVVIVTASDGSLTDTQTLMVTVNNLNEAPVIDSDGGSATGAVSVAENGTAITTVHATDADANTTLTYSITGGADAALLQIDATTGALSFKSATNFEAPTDAGADNVYDVIVQASDGTLTDTQAIAVTVTNVNEAPVISNDSVVTVDENNTKVLTIAASDVDAGTTLWYAFEQAEGEPDYSSLFTIDRNTGELSFTLAPDYEVTGDGNFKIMLVAGDGQDATIVETRKAVTIQVANVNDVVPAFTSHNGGSNGTVSISENSTAVETLTATDTDVGASLTYTIVGGPDAALFNVNESTGALSFKSAPNFEAIADAGRNNVYDVVVKVSDGTFTDTQAIAITITDVNDAPVIHNGSDVTVIENSTAVLTAAATDEDFGTALLYSIVAAEGGPDFTGLFTINQNTGVLAFKTAPDFEAGPNMMKIVLVASDGQTSTSAPVTIHVANVNEWHPMITSNGGGLRGRISVLENSTAVTTVTATDADAVGTLAYAIVDGADAALFEIDANTGALAFRSAPNFWSPTDAGGNGVYDVVVRVTDGIFTDLQLLAVSVVDVNDAPTLTSNGGGATGTVSVAENTTEVTNLTAIDADIGNTLSYAIVGGADAALFNVDATTGKLTFKSAPNFEAPADAGGNNVYDVAVEVSDGRLSDTQALSVTVTNANEVVVITSNGGGATGTVSIAENTTTVTTVTAVDPEGSTLAYSISGGADAALFQIDAATGRLAFISAPDFEAPADAGRDNVYNVVVQTSDGVWTDTQALAVSVTNVNGPVLTGTAASDTLTGTAEQDVLIGLGGTDSMDGQGSSDIYVVKSRSEHQAAEIHDTGTQGIDELRFTSTRVETLTIFAGDTGLERVVIGTGNGAVADSSGMRALKIDATLAANGLTLVGNAGSNQLTGTAFADTLDGRAGADKMVGGAGNDTYIVDHAKDAILERAGGGTDTVMASVGYSLAANVENLTLTGTNNIGGIGNGLANTIIGNGGDNTLIGGLGHDTLTGGAGADHFVFNTKANAATNVDGITDFSHNDGDKIQFSLKIFQGFSGLGELSEDKFWAGAGLHTAHDETDRIIFNTSTGDLFYDADGSGSNAAAVLVAHLDGSPVLTYGDIQIIG